MRAAATSRPLSGRLPGLDGLRGCAILMVMAVHFVGNATPRTPADQVVLKLASYGLLGVDLFFVLSGFLITGLLLDAKGDPHYFRNFYARRTLRIFPLYYAVLAILFVLLPAVVALPPALEESRVRQAWLWTYTANFLIASESSWALPYVSHFWSLAIEEHFYLVWPLVVFAVRRRTLERICLSVITGALALRIALSLQGVSEISISVLTPCRLDAICAGAFLAAFARREGGPALLARRSRTLLLLAGGAAFVVSAFCAATRSGLEILHPIRGTLYAIFFAAVVLLSAGRPEGGARGRRGAAYRPPIRLIHSTNTQQRIRPAPRALTVSRTDLIRSLPRRTQRTTPSAASATGSASGFASGLSNATTVLVIGRAWPTGAEPLPSAAAGSSSKTPNCTIILAEDWASRFPASRNSTG